LLSRHRIRSLIAGLRANRTSLLNVRGTRCRLHKSPSSGSWQTLSHPLFSFGTE